MDLSTLTEAQQQQLQQLHQQFQQHQLEQQQKQQQQEQMASSQAYDPSQPQQFYDQSNQQQQAYDQSTQAYYNYHHYYPYYHNDYANTYQQQQPDSNAVQPPGISAPHEAAAAASQVQQQQQLPYYSQGAAEQQQPSSSAYTVPSGLNPAAAAAVAALSQLSQFAGTMDAAERAMAGMQERQWQAKAIPMMPPHIQGGFHHGAFPAGRSPYRGGGRRGGGPFRGGGRGSHSRPDSSGSHFRGRGRGSRGGGRRFQQHASSSHPETATMEELASALEQGHVPPVAVEQGESQQSTSIPASAMIQGQAPAASATAIGKAASTRRQPQIAWCELCRVDCTSLEILEQHKNGKKHKKNLQRLEELQNVRNPMAMAVAVPTPMSVGTSVIPASGPVSAPVPVSAPTKTPMPEIQNESELQPESKLEVIVPPENMEGAKTNMSAAPENMPAEADNDSNMEAEEQNDLAEKPEATEAEPVQAPARKRRFDRFDGRKRGMKRNMRGGRGGKRLRTLERQSKHVEPPKETPIICDLCNVKCDRQAVFESHVAGKKHLSKVKRFQGHQAAYGSLGLQALYPPNPNAPPIFIPPVQHHHQQAFYHPQGHLPPVPYMPPKVDQPVAGSEFASKQAVVAVSNTVVEQVGQAASNSRVEQEGQEAAPVAAPIVAEQEAQKETVTGGKDVQQDVGIESEYGV